MKKIIILEPKIAIPIFSIQYNDMKQKEKQKSQYQYNV